MASREESDAQRDARRALNLARRQANAGIRGASSADLEAAADKFLKGAPRRRRGPDVPTAKRLEAMGRDAAARKQLAFEADALSGQAKGVRKPKAALTPDARTEATIASMAKFASKTAADGLAGATTRPFLADLAALIVHTMRAKVRAGGDGGRPIADGTLLTRFDNREKATPLNDTGRMALALSADFHANTSKRFALRIGPLGKTPWSAQAKFKTIDANTHPTKLPTGSTGSVGLAADVVQRAIAAQAMEAFRAAEGRGAETAVEEAGLAAREEGADDAGGASAAEQKSKLTYAEVAWLHELGWSFKVTESMADMFRILGGFDRTGFRDNEGHSIFGAGAALLYGVMTVRLGKGMGRVAAVGKVINVPARPFMQPAMEESANLVAAKWPAISAQVFNDWIATGPTRKLVPDEEGRMVVLQGHVATPKDFVTFASPIGAAMRRKARAKLRAGA